ncbi:DNA-binding NarL/FixJ family response regulator [Ochrobactrum sp. RH2CCR150]|nr:DNA-binding NarL/FixJ family response regulator [Ochrobactrum sp. RH2CCR150]
MSADLERKRRKMRSLPTMVIVAKHTLARTCVVKFLAHELAGWDFIDMASTADLAKAIGRDVALIALDLAGRAIDSPTLLEDLLAAQTHFPAASIALLSNRDDILMESEAIKMGVRGFFTSSLPVEIALAGVRLVLAGGVFCPHPLGAHGSIQPTISINGKSALEDMLDDDNETVSRAPRMAAIAGFTPREVDVLTELQRGHSNKIIAEKLNLSGNTVKMHLQHIMRKLRVQNRTEVVLLLGAKTSPGINTVQ